MEQKVKRRRAHLQSVLEKLRKKTESQSSDEDASSAEDDSSPDIASSSMKVVAEPAPQITWEQLMQMYREDLQKNPNHTVRP